MITFLVVTVLLLLFVGWRAIVFAVLWIVGVAIFLTVVWNLEANAQEMDACGPRAEMVQMLADVYGEKTQLAAKRLDGVVIEFLASKSSGTWTLLASDVAGGEACVLDEGEGWGFAKQGEPT